MEWKSIKKDGLPNDNGKLQKFLVCRSHPSATGGDVTIDTEFFTNRFHGKQNITHWAYINRPKED